MLDMITPNFSRAEMSCRCGCGLDHMDEQFMKMLQQLRNQLGPLPVTSGVRCEKHNHKSGGYPKSAHLQSKGADIRIFGPRALQLVEEARRLGFSGIGISQKGDKSSRFIHLDILPRTALWSYWATVDWSNRFTFGRFIVSYSSSKWLGKWSRKKAIMRSLFDGYLPNKRPKIFALDGSQGNCNVFTFLEIFEDMESIWKMELSPKELSLWLGMILGKNMKKGEKKAPRWG